MTLEFRQQIHDLLQSLPTHHLDSLKQLFWSELNYDRADQPWSTRDWPEEIVDLLAAPPNVFASIGAQEGFRVLYIHLKNEHLLIGQERQIIRQLHKQNPYALYIFSNRDQDYWHFINIKYQEETNGISRLVQRRIVISPEERLRTATERISMLDIQLIGMDLSIIAPLAIQQLHDDAFDVEKVTKQFFKDYRFLFELSEEKITGISSKSELRLFVQHIFNRLLFIIFLERKGWLSFYGEKDYLQTLWNAHIAEKKDDQNANFYRDRLKLLFFSGLTTPNEVDIVNIKDGFLQTRIGHVPYLNGGLFEKTDFDNDENVYVPDEIFELAINRLFYHYNFTVTESTPFDIEVAVDPEMLGKIFEELITGRHETGSYYTPKPVVSFMCQEALKGFLQTKISEEDSEAIILFVDEKDSSKINDPEKLLESLRSIRICDPACGSGAYLLGILHELIDCRDSLFVSRQIDPLSNYQRKLEIIQHNLYGVDIDPFAINIARLRLWLSLIVAFEGSVPPPLPNLDFKIETGDSLLTPDPTGGLQPDLFRNNQINRLFTLKSDYLVSHGSQKIELKNQISQLKSEIHDWARPSGTQSGFDWVVEFSEVFTGEGGFGMVISNPPYVRADAQFKHVDNEEERQAEISKWKNYRNELKKSGNYKTLYEKWDLYIPFLERAYQLLSSKGQLIYIISSAYNASKYSKKSREFFLLKTKINRIDFCSEISLFEAGVYNTILHLTNYLPENDFIPKRFRRFGESSEDFIKNIEKIPTKPQSQMGRNLFRKEIELHILPSHKTIPLELICYISKGMVVNSDEKKYQGKFGLDDVVSDIQTDIYSKRFVLGKDIDKWYFRNIRYLEWDTVRSPSCFSRPTFPELHEARIKLIAVRTPGLEPKVAYDNLSNHFDASSVGFIPWNSLKGVINLSISKSSKYSNQSPEGDREFREDLSKKYCLKYILAIMNSSFAKDWLMTKRRSRRHIYPDDWKILPIVQISLDSQLELVSLVDSIFRLFDEFGYPIPGHSFHLYANIEKNINSFVNKIYNI